MNKKYKHSPLSELFSFFGPPFEIIILPSLVDGKTIAV
jgi:hypothetical protein